MALIFDGNATNHKYMISPGSTTPEDLEESARRFFQESLPAIGDARFEIIDADDCKVILSLFNSAVQTARVHGTLPEFTINIVDNAGGNARTNANNSITPNTGNKKARANFGLLSVITSCLVRFLEWAEYDGLMRPLSWSVQNNAAKQYCIRRVMASNEFKIWMDLEKPNSDTTVHARIARGRIQNQIQYRTPGTKKCQKPERTDADYRFWQMQQHKLGLDARHSGRPQDSSPQPPASQDDAQPVTPPQGANGVAALPTARSNQQLDNQLGAAQNRCRAMVPFVVNPDGEAPAPTRAPATLVPRGSNRTEPQRRATDPQLPVTTPTYANVLRLWNELQEKVGNMEDNPSIKNHKVKFRINFWAENLLNQTYLNGDHAEQKVKKTLSILINELVNLGFIKWTNQQHYKFDMIEDGNLIGANEDDNLNDTFESMGIGENGAGTNSCGQKKRTKEQTRATDSPDPASDPNDTFTPAGPQKKTVTRVPTATEVESAKSVLTYGENNGASRKRQRSEEAPSYSSRRSSARVASRDIFPHRFFVAEHRPQRTVVERTRGAKDYAMHTWGYYYDETGLPSKPTCNMIYARKSTQEGWYLTSDAEPSRRC